MDDDLVKSLRALRTSAGFDLKPSHYLRDRYVNEHGVENQVSLRNYQKIGIMNLLQVPCSILGDDTGLGKTLTSLSTVGYVWLKEPEFVPVILTKKSSLHQWADETRRFMQGMEVVTADDEPHARDKTYESFFLKGDPSVKKLLVMTYDTLFKDAQESVVRDRSEKPPKGSRKALADAREAVRNVQARFDPLKIIFEAHFEGRMMDIHDHIRSILKTGEDPNGTPIGWTEKDEKALRDIMAVHTELAAAKRAVEVAKDVVEPPKVVKGVIQYVMDMMEARPGTKLMLIMDEMHVLKNPKSKTHELVAKLANMSERRIGMTATPVKNRLMEFFALFKIIWPSLFPKVTHFQNDYCLVKMQPIPGNRKVPVVVGYKNLDGFVQKIEPFYLSRKKQDVAKELPELVTREIRCELSNMQEELYDLAEVGALTKGSDADTSTAEVATAMVRLQQAANAPDLIKDEEGNPYRGGSCKIDALMDLLEDELEGVKVLVFSRFEQMISLIGEEMTKRKIRYVRITGKENKASDREKSRATFQNPDSGVNVILITTAGTESLNLQATEQVIFVDAPWSYGDYAQTLGRMIRIGSIHKMVVATHLIAVKQDGGKTIDQYVIAKLREKKKLSDKVSGEGIKGGLQFVDSDITMDLFQEIRAAKGQDVGHIVQRAKEAVASAGGKKKGSKKTQAQTPHIESHPVVSVPDMSDL